MANPKRKVAETKDETLDEFLGGMFQQTQTGEEAGMPSLDWLKSKFKTKSASIVCLKEEA